MATDPELLERPARAKSTAKAKAPAKAKRSADKPGPTVASLRAKVERAAQQGPKGRRDIGAMTHAERDKYLFGI